MSRGGCWAVTKQLRFTEEALLLHRQRASQNRTVTPGPHSCHAVMLACAAQLRRTGWAEACRRYITMAKNIRLGAPRLP
jgi:hypothetical protein